MYIETKAQKNLDFEEKIGILTFEKLNEWGIDPDSLSGSFDPDRVSELEKHCAVRTECHIVSCSNDRYINRKIDGAQFYYLANGDADPNLEWKQEDLAVAQCLRLAAHPSPELSVDAGGHFLRLATHSNPNSMAPRTGEGPCS